MIPSQKQKRVLQRPTWNSSRDLERKGGYFQRITNLSTETGTSNVDLVKTAQGRLWTFLQSIVFTATPVYCWASIAKPVKLDSKPCNSLNNKNRENCLTSLLRAWHTAQMPVVYSGNWLAFVSCSGYHPSKPTKPWNSWKTGRWKSQKPGTSPALYKMWSLPLLHCRLRLN